jgi:hypothetical protein
MAMLQLLCTSTAPRTTPSTAPRTRRGHGLTSVQRHGILARLNRANPNAIIDLDSPFTPQEVVSAEIAEAVKSLYRSDVLEQTFPNFCKTAAMLRNQLITQSSPPRGNTLVQDGVTYEIRIVRGLDTVMPNICGHSARIVTPGPLSAQLRVIDNVAPVAAGGDITTTTEDNRLAGVSVFGDPDAIISPEVYLHQASLVCREVNERKGCLTSPPNDHWSMVHAHAVVKEWNRFLQSF